MTATPVTGSKKDRVLIFDTTLRDGEQCPGATMTLEEKLEVAEMLDTMGVDIIEAGFPIASNGDFDAVAEIARRAKNATIAGLARAISGDIARAGEAVRFARKPRIHTFVSTSPIHLAHQMRKTEEEVLDIIVGDGRPGSQPRRGRRMVGDGRDPHLDRLPLPLRRSSDQGRRDDNQPARHGGLRDAGRVSRACSRPCASARRAPTRRSSRSTATTISAWPSPIRLPASRVVPVRSNARSTASASGQATRRSRRSSWRSAPAATCCPTTLASTRRCSPGRPEDGLERDLVPGAVQQGDRRPERLRA